MPASTTPTGNVQLQVPGLGTAEGLAFPSGVRQIAGIRYATLAKRWTRSQLCTSWQNNFHDGTKLGPSAPNPPEYNGRDFLTPVVPPPHHSVPEEDELNCLRMNITAPTVKPGCLVPVMVYIHGGSFLYGGANRPVFDGVNFVTYSVERGTPVVAVNFNYRVGLGGFLASKAIKADLERDGHTGVGNFGLTDQQVALEWVQRYISAFGGDSERVTIYGESAGGMSVSHQLVAKTPAKFHSAIAMSGHLNTIPTWSLEHHEKHYRGLLTYLKLDPDSPDSLAQLRAVPEHVVKEATLYLEGVFVATGNPCDDGVFHSSKPSFDTIESPPSWLQAYMVGDVLDEAMIFTESLAEETYASVQSRLTSHLGREHTDAVLNMFNITPDMSPRDLNTQLQISAGDSAFKAQNWVGIHRSKIPRTFGYHFDRVSTYDNMLEGLAYHALDLLYVFLNFDEEFTPKQQKLARQMASHFIDFAYGKDPWPRICENSTWMRYGPDDSCTAVTEVEDEPVRRYSRMQAMMDMGIYQTFIAAMDDICVKRYRMGTFEWQPPHN